MTEAKEAPRSALREWGKSIAIPVVIWLFLKIFLVEAFRIPSPSMENTLLPGDFLFVNKAIYGAVVPFTSWRLPAFREPARGDVVVFDPTSVAAGPLRRVHDLPAGADRLVSDAIGIDAVVVAGTLLRRAGRDLLDPRGKLPGRLLRHGCAPD